MTQEIIVTTGIYDLIKDHIRRKKTNVQEEEIMKVRLKNAKQLTRKNIPVDVVNLGAKLTVKNRTTNEEEIFKFVAPDKAKRKHNTESVLSSMGLAFIGTKVGDVVRWNINEDESEFEIVAVEQLE
ncbi:GreA/GreB family elongation factor [Flavobacterium sp.]